MTEKEGIATTSAILVAFLFGFLVGGVVAFWLIAKSMSL
jgi:tetrahydromethanopterin S-methyltransferase subunit B